jgi:hypothetical protein
MKEKNSQKALDEKQQKNFGYTTTEQLIFYPD